MAENCRLPKESHYGHVCDADLAIDLVTYKDVLRYGLRLQDRAGNSRQLCIRTSTFF